MTSIVSLSYFKTPKMLQCSCNFLPSRSFSLCASQQLCSGKGGLACPVVYDFLHASLQHLLMVPLQLIPKARNFDINNLLKDHQAVEQVAHLMLADLAYTVDGGSNWWTRRNMLFIRRSAHDASSWVNFMHLQQFKMNFRSKLFYNSLIFVFLYFTVIIIN